MSMKILLLQIDKLRSCVIYFENQSPNMETRDCKLSNDIYSLSILLKVFSKILF